MLSFEFYPPSTLMLRLEKKSAKIYYAGEIKSIKLIQIFLCFSELKINSSL